MLGVRMGLLVGRVPDIQLPLREERLSTISEIHHGQLEEMVEKKT